LTPPPLSFNVTLRRCMEATVVPLLNKVEAQGVSNRPMNHDAQIALLSLYVHRSCCCWNVPLPGQLPIEKVLFLQQFCSIYAIEFARRGLVCLCLTIPILVSSYSSNDVDVLCSTRFSFPNGTVECFLSSKKVASSSGAIAASALWLDFPEQHGRRHGRGEKSQSICIEKTCSCTVIYLWPPAPFGCAMSWLCGGSNSTWQHTTYTGIRM
jgi:hypothetical protein